MRKWLAIGAVCLLGCSSSSSTSSVPTAVPALATPETNYVGILVHVTPSITNTLGWRLRNMNAPGNLPIDVSKVEPTAQALSGQWVKVAAHSVQEPNGRMVLYADSISSYTPPN
jgi:hypothetical protein